MRKIVFSAILALGGFAAFSVHAQDPVPCGEPACPAPSEACCAPAPCDTVPCVPVPCEEAPAPAE